MKNRRKSFECPFEIQHEYAFANVCCVCGCVCVCMCGGGVVPWANSTTNLLQSEDENISVPENKKLQDSTRCNWQVYETKV